MGARVGRKENALKAISIWPAYAMEIARGLKRREYRSWSTKYRGDLLVCCTKGHAEIGTIPGHAFFVVELTDIKKLGDHEYAWILDNVRIIKPVPVKGQQGLFNVDIEPEYSPDFDNMDSQLEWEYEYLLPLVKGARKNSKGEWVIR